MKKLENIIFIFPIIGIIIVGIFITVVHSVYKDKKDTTIVQITNIIENAYYEGQKDALLGDIRIKLNPDNTFTITKICWDLDKIIK